MVALSSPAFAAEQQGHGAAPANVVLIVADDLGIMDVCSYARRISGNGDGCYYETPNIDALAEAGVSFSRAYAAPLCSPTRATLLSGRYGARLGFNNAFAMGDFQSYASTGKQPPIGFLLHDGVKPAAGPPERALISAASSSALVSGSADDRGADVASFAEYATWHDSVFIGKWHLGGGGIAAYGPASQGFEEIAFHDEGWSDYFAWRGEWTRPGGLPDGTYLTDAITRQAVDWIHGRKSSDRPFILVVSHFAVHSPFQAKPEAVQHFENKPNRGWMGHGNAVYAAMLQSLDQSVGAIVGALEGAGLRESTMVVFMSDNGGVAVDKGQQITSNKPFRGEKGTVYEGGIRVPLIISWPERLQRNKLVDLPVHVVDLFPTIVDAAGYSTARYQEFGDGHSLLSLAGQPTAADYQPRPLFFYDPFYRPLPIEKTVLEATPKTVVIDGRYKLIQYHLGYAELYDLERDPYEKTDIATGSETTVTRLRALAAQWEKTLPKRYRSRENPRYDPARGGDYPPYRDDYLKLLR